MYFSKIFVVAEDGFGYPFCRDWIAFALTCAKLAAVDCAVTSFSTFSFATLYTSCIVASFAACFKFAFCFVTTSLAFSRYVASVNLLSVNRASSFFS